MIICDIYLLYFYVPCFSKYNYWTELSWGIHTAHYVLNCCVLFIVPTTANILSSFKNTSWLLSGEIYTIQGYILQLYLLYQYYFGRILWGLFLERDICKVLSVISRKLISDYWGYANDRYDSQEHACMIFNPVKNKVWALAPPP